MVIETNQAFYVYDLTTEWPHGAVAVAVAQTHCTAPPQHHIKHHHCYN